MSIEAMKQGLEALELWFNHKLDEDTAWQAHTSLRQAITEAEKQEPVAHHWIVPDFGLLFPTEEAVKRYQKNIGSSFAPTACYTHPPKREWVSLTDFEIDQIYCDHHDNNGDPISLGYKRAIEAKLREKNA